MIFIPAVSSVAMTIIRASATLLLVSYIIDKFSDKANNHEKEKQTAKSSNPRP